MLMAEGGFTMRIPRREHAPFPAGTGGGRTTCCQAGPGDGAVSVAESVLAPPGPIPNPVVTQGSAGEYCGGDPVGGEAAAGTAPSLPGPTPPPRGGAAAARWAHNPKVAGSNPAPATIENDRDRYRSRSFFWCIPQAIPLVIDQQESPGRRARLPGEPDPLLRRWPPRLVCWRTV